MIKALEALIGRFTQRRPHEGEVIITMKYNGITYGFGFRMDAFPPEEHVQCCERLGWAMGDLLKAKRTM